MLHIGWMKKSFNVSGEVLCGKVSFFFWFWKLELHNGHYGVFGNSQKLVEAKNFISQQCVIDF